MLAISDPLYISPADYLAGEIVSPIRHEYRQGQVFAMSGGTQNHAIITGNLFAILKAHLRGSGCRVFSENMKVRLKTAKAYYYPDVVVTCDDRDRQPQQHFIDYPRLIIEVLSPSTAAFDRGEKFADYRTIPSLEDYVLVSTDRPQVAVYHRTDPAEWSYQVYPADLNSPRSTQGLIPPESIDPAPINPKHITQSIPFLSVEHRLSIDDIYEDTDIT